MYRIADLKWKPIELFGVVVPVATPDALLRMKRDTVRAQDGADRPVA